MNSPSVSYTLRSSHVPVYACLCDRCLPPPRPSDPSAAGASPSCLHSADRRLLSAVSVFFSSTHEGRLYQVAPLGPASEQPVCAALVGTHSYTSPLVLAVRQAHMLHTLTLTGLGE